MSALDTESLQISNQRGRLIAFLPNYRLPEADTLGHNIHKVKTSGELMGTAGSLMLATQDPNVVAAVVVVAKAHPKDHRISNRGGRDLVIERMGSVLNSIIGRHLGNNWWMIMRLLDVPRYDCCEEIPGSVNLLKFKANHRYLREVFVEEAVTVATVCFDRKDRALKYT